MACRVVTISRSLAAGGEEIGRIVAGKLRFWYVDHEIITEAAERVGVSPESIEQAERESIEQAERTPGLVTRILKAMAAASVVAEGGHVLVPADTSPSYERLIEQVIYETASKGGVVIVAHGGSIALAGMHALLRVLVTASPAVRAERLAQQANLDEREAKKTVEDSDRQRREYLRRFYNVQQELPTHYDLMINTDVLTVSEAAQVIVSAAKSE